MTIGQYASELEKLGVKRFCFRIHNDRFEAMIVNRDGDVFGVTEDSVEEAATSLIAALKTKQILGNDGWGELIHPNLN